MQRRHRKELIPIHLHRTIDAIVETGSVTNAAALLHLTQAAISTQIKRLEEILGGPIFEKSGVGLRLTERGKAELEYGRRMLSLNDQLLAYAGPRPALRQLTIGMPPWIAGTQLTEVVKACRSLPEGETTGFRADAMKILAEDLLSGRLDIAYLCETAIPPETAVVQWEEPVRWIGARGSSLDDRAVVPLVSWYGSLTDRLGIKALEATGRRFSVEFSSPDINSRHAAVVAGLGYTLTNTRLITPGTVVVPEPLLPAVRKIPSGIYVRSDLDRERFAGVIRAFTKAIEPPYIREAVVQLDSAQTAFRQDPRPRRSGRPGR
jgi:DNA-binding transcriptional LysR family regulator